MHRVEDLPLRIHPVLSPPRTTVEHTVIDLAHVAADPAQLVDVVMRACQRRLTTPARLFAVAARRPRLTRRSLFQEVLAQISDGAETPLERTYLLKVERAHGLPDGRRQVHAASAAGSVWRDVVYDEFSTVVELDGRRGHEDEPFRDYARDNRSLLTGLAPLRYGWHATVGNPCAVALEVARALRQRGWKGMPRPCGPGCPAEMMRASA